MTKIKLLFTILFISITSYATTTTVNSQSSFNSALSSATNGDIIEWESGTYSNIFMDINKNGITVKATTAGEVVFNGSSKVEIDADNVTFSGFQYIGGNIGTDHVVFIYGSNVLFTDVNISGYTSYKYLIVDDESQYTTISYCNFENRINTPDQNILSILVDSNNPGYHKVQYCSFKNFTGANTDGDAGVEPIRIGVSTTASYESKSIVEHCYFTQCNGDGEIISHKATQCIYRYNTFDNNPEAELVLRHGDAGIVYGNFFINNKGGVRIEEGSNHLIFNNYFSNLSSRSLNLNNGSKDRLDNILIAYNTFVKSGPIDIENGTNEAENVTLANNIFTDPLDKLFKDTTENETWIGNIANGTIGDTNSSNFTITDPLLSLNSKGYYQLAATSPAIDASTSGFPTLPTYENVSYDNDILLDVKSNNRPSNISLKDVGAEEYNTNTLIDVYVTADNTGPRYLMPQNDLSSAELIKKLGSDITFYPNPLNKENLTFNFDFNNTTDVKIDIYEITGRKLKTLIHQSFNSGNNSVSENFNLKAGVYLLEFKVKSTNGISISKIEKLIVI